MQVNLKTRAKSHGHGQADTDRRTPTHTVVEKTGSCVKNGTKYLKEFFFDYLKIIGI